MCHKCDTAEDIAQHTVEICPIHEKERDILKNVIDEDLLPVALIRTITDENRKRRAVITFCEKVMTAKKAEERIRENMDPARITRRRNRVAGRQGRRIVPTNIPGT